MNLTEIAEGKLSRNGGGQMRAEILGRLVRERWIAWAKTQTSRKTHWLVPWEELDEPSREVDRLIGEDLYVVGYLAGLGRGLVVVR